MGFRVETFWVERTDRYGPSRDGIQKPIYRRLDTGEEFEGAPVGALLVYEPYTRPDGYRAAGADGKSIVCVTPGGWWFIDDRCSNCTLPKDIEHKCWVRHGTVGDRLTIDKNGRTCSAGGGSIAQKNFHGFLKNGELYAC
jgi:hypothetical protein